MDRKFMTDYFYRVYDDILNDPDSRWKNDPEYVEAKRLTMEAEEKLADLCGGMFSDTYIAHEYFLNMLIRRLEYVYKEMFLAGAEARECMLR